MAGQARDEGDASHMGRMQGGGGRTRNPDGTYAIGVTPMQDASTRKPRVQTTAAEAATESDQPSFLGDSFAKT